MSRRISRAAIPIQTDMARVTMSVLIPPVGARGPHDGSAHKLNSLEERGAVRSVYRPFTLSLYDHSAYGVASLSRAVFECTCASDVSSEP